MNIIVISDKENEKRRQNVMNIFGKAHLEFTFFDAIMANKMDPVELEEKALPNTFLSPSEIGCALSHLAVYDLLLASNQKSAFICEDDIYFTEHFDIHAIQNIVDFVESTDEPRIVVLQKSIYHHKKINMINESTAIYSARNLFGAFGYIINRAAANNIRRIQTPVRFEIDAFKFYYWLNAAKLYCLNHAMVEHLDESVIPSSIGEHRHYKADRKFLKNSAYRDLYKYLSLKNKIRSQLCRLQKALYKPLETLNY